MSPEGDISTGSASEVAIANSDVLEIVVIALTVLSDAPIHFVLYVNIDSRGLCL